MQASCIALPAGIDSKSSGEIMNEASLIVR